MPRRSRRPTRAPRSLSERFRSGELHPDLLAAGCPSRVVLKHVASQWGFLAMIALESGTQRFGELRRRIDGVSERMLAQTLQRLEADGLVARKSYHVVPPRVEYRLTPLGVGAAKKVRALADWIEASVPAVTAHWEGDK